MSSNKWKSPINTPRSKRRTVAETTVLESESDQCGQELRLFATESDQSKTIDPFLDILCIKKK